MDDHLKTTINLPDGLWEQVRQHAKKHNTTVTVLIQAGLPRILHETKLSTAGPG